MTAENNKAESKENEVILNPITDNTSNLKSIKAKNFVDALFEMLFKDNNIYKD